MPQSTPEQANEYLNTDKGRLLQKYGTGEQLACRIMQQYVMLLLRVQSPNEQGELERMMEERLLRLGKPFWATDAAKRLVSAVKCFRTGINPELLSAYITELSSAAFGDYERAARARDRADRLFLNQLFNNLTATGPQQPSDKAIYALTDAVLSYMAPPKA